MARRRRYRVKGQETVVPSAARTTTASGPTVTGWSRGGGSVVSELEITAVGGTPNIVLRIQDSPDGTTWTTRDTYPAQTGTAVVVRPLPEGMAQYQRADWTITGGTPSVTFSVQFAANAALLV